MLYSCFLKPSRDYLRGFLIAAWGRVPKLQSSPFQKHHFIFSLACGSFFVTPAYAGKRLPLPDIAAQTQDHPYVCGEKGGQFIDWLTNLGSPPRMRGKRPAGL